LMVQALYPHQPLPLPQAAWYPKTHASFHDILALLRCRLWQHFLFQRPAASTPLWLFSRQTLQRLLSAVSF
jgi:hypothetical protein